MRPNASSTPSSLPIGVLNWLRTRAYAPTKRTSALVPPTAEVGSEAAHQHHPALARVFAPADDPVERHEDILAGIGAVLERRVERHVAPADVHAGRVGRNERAGNAQIFFVPDQPFRIVEAEGETQKRRDRA